MGQVHTPGSWETDKISVRSSGPDGRQICLCEITVRGKPYEETYDEALANARLIAAAPDLLKALEAARKRLEYYGQISDRRHFDHDMKEVFPAIDTALSSARATGGTE